jgi:hypothetical protein
VELATDAEAIAGIDGTRAVTPKGLMAKLTALLGAGAPSAFVKSLLTAIDVVAFRTALAIKTAASYDIGVGNGLDADLLDGQHGAYYRAWSNLTDVPATFTPASHQHSAADITSGLLPVARGGTGAGSFTAGSYLLGNGTGAFAVRTPAQVLADIGAAPVLHSHAISDVNGLQTALDARPIQTLVTSQISAAINGLINGSPGALDTLNELAAAMGNDANFAATVTNALASKANLSGAGFTGASSVNFSPSGSQIVFWRIGWGNDTNRWAHVLNGDGSYALFSYPGAVEALRLSLAGDLNVRAISCLTINASSSDIRLKSGVEPAAPRPLHRLLAELPDTHGALSTYIHKADHKRRLGPIAQDMERVEPAYMGTIDISEGQVDGVEAGTYKTVDKASAAYEQAMWSGQEIDRLHDIIGQLQERLSLLESH